VGLYYSKIDVDSVNDIDLSSSRDDYNFGFNAKAGLNFGVTDNLMLDLGYKYQQVLSDGDDLRGHTLEAGLTVKF
jgi:outer membrane autotransporter protein